MTSPPHVAPLAARSRWAALGPIALVILAGLAAYHNSFSVPFLFDDEPSILDNPTIRHLWPVWGALSPPAGGLTVSGRPVLNLTLAVNYALSGPAVWSYHVVNLVIHGLAGLTLFGLVCRTLLRPVLRARFGDAARPLALVVALLWTLHPLQTEAVTYLSQRAESLMALFYLLTLYGFIRASESPTPGRWQTVAVAACLLGMASKEVMVSAPLIVLLYDRTFVAGTFRAAWRQRRLFYGGLSGTWLLLGWLVVHTADRGGTAGLGTNVTWWTYALIQGHAIVHYLRLVVWPSPLTFDYGVGAVRFLADVGGPAALVVLMLAATGVALWRWPAAGLAGAAFFAVLAPSSSVIPVATQMMAEHRMYLPLAAVLALLVAGLHLLLGRRGVVLGLALAAAFGWLTVRRNADYRSELSLWQDTVAKCPENSRAQGNLGKALYSLGRTPEALTHLEESLRLGPPLSGPHYTLGVILAGMGRRDEALAHYREAVRLNPALAEAQLNFGVALLDLDRVADALPHLRAAARLKPDLPEAHCNLGNALARSGQTDRSLTEYEEALRLRPDYAVAHYDFGVALFTLRRLSEAKQQFEHAVRARPDYAAAHYNLGIVLLELHQVPEAIHSFEQALRLQPDFPAAREQLDRLETANPSRTHP